MDGGKTLLTVNEVAALLRCSVRNVRRLIRAKALAAISVGVGRQRVMWRIRHTDLDDYMRRGSVTMLPQPYSAPTITLRRSRYKPQILV
jgi:excisionase family DNA binding protein